MYRAGKYKPLTTEEAVVITKEMYKILDSAGINIIRVGLKSTDLITEGGEIQGHTYHPAFRQLVEGEIAKEELESQLLALLEVSQHQHSGDSHGADTQNVQAFTFTSNGSSFSNMVGNSKANKLYFADKYPDLKISFKVNSSLEDGRYIVVKC